MNKIKSIIIQLKDKCNAVKSKVCRVFEPITVPGGMLVKKHISPVLGEGRWIAAFFAAFCFASGFEIIDHKGGFAVLTDYLTTINKLRFLLILVIVTLVLWFLSVFVKLKPLIPYCLLGFSMFYSIVILNYINDNLYLKIACCLIVFFICCYVTRGDKLSLDRFTFDHMRTKMIAVCMFVFFAVFISYGSILRYQCYYSSTFDFGIFTQMFENMRTGGAPITTCERNAILSHFGVHFSPIYYTALPIYALVPRPETLLVLQAVLIAAGVFPLCGIGRLIGLSPKANTAFVAIYILFPAFGSGAFYDFHENAFLALPLLFTVYFMLKKKTLWMFVSALLLLSVKEDAAIYVFAIALYIMFSRRGIGKGIMLFLMAGLYFFIASRVVASLGTGVMDNRLANYWPSSVGNNGSLLDVVKTCFYDFAYALSQIFQEGKFTYIIYIMLPVLFTPLFAKKTNVLLLLMPFMVINLMSNWPYQYEMGYQYIFGSGALIIVAAMFNIQPLPARIRKTLLVGCVAISIILSYCFSVTRITFYYKLVDKGAVSIAQTDECLDEIPEQAGVTAYTFFTPRLYRHDTLYMYPINGNQRTEYLIMDTRWGNTQEDTDKLNAYIGNDYTQLETRGYCRVYKLTDDAMNRLRSGNLLLENKVN